MLRVIARWHSWRLLGTAARAGEQVLDPETRLVLAPSVLESSQPPVQTKLSSYRVHHLVVHEGGRAKRFAKIAGEMISLSAVEAMAAEIWPGALSIVVSLPNARKGERLVLLTSDNAATREAFLRHVRLKGVSELSVPSEIVWLERLPLLGSGKPDYVAALEVAKARSKPLPDEEPSAAA